ncbi:hypothetical protein C1645_814978 [Glomus cerebriforme]|uniref:Uncharacterized protein n=1 Tax=Glomus cerebriforme TaxID=658196 RepID=A0A397TIL4_9GLOM|nr:hypothetical protein C1645_814978 [Glomus cerebriforme]
MGVAQHIDQCVFWCISTPPKLPDEIYELRKKVAEVEAKNAELIKQMMEENNRYDARIEVLEKNKTDITDRVPTLEQKHSQDDITNNNFSNFNSGVNYICKTNEDKEKDVFLVDDSSSDTAYVSGTVNNIEKTDVPKITNCTSSELSHKIGVIKDITNSAVNSSTINDWSASEEIGKTVSLGYNQSVSENLEEIRKTVSLEYYWVASESLEEIESKADYQDKLVVELSIVTEFIQVLESISIKRLANLFCQANGVRNRSITAKRAEITAWRLFSERFENKILELKSEYKKFADRTARTQIYAKMKPYLIGYMVNQVTCSADRISKLTNPQIEYIIEQVKLKTITSPVNEISETIAITSAYGSNSDDSDVNESDSNANKSDSDIYFKSDDFDSNDEYDHELYERLTCEKIARIAKLENKTSTKPDLEDYFPEEEVNKVKPVDENATNDLDKIIIEVLEHETYFDDPAPQSVMNPSISLVTA